MRFLKSYCHCSPLDVHLPGKKSKHQLSTRLDLSRLHDFGMSWRSSILLSWCGFRVLAVSNASTRNMPPLSPASIPASIVSCSCVGHVWLQNPTPPKTLTQSMFWMPWNILFRETPWWCHGKDDLMKKTWKGLKRLVIAMGSRVKELFWGTTTGSKGLSVPEQPTGLSQADCKYESCSRRGRTDVGCWDPDRAGIQPWAT